jgi:toxin ParE1/3/4
MVAVIWRRRAMIDVGRIAVYIGEFNPHAAAHMVAKLNRAARSLTSYPLRGRLGDEPGTRELSVVQPYVIVYRVTSRGDVEILRIWHAAQSRQEDE